MAELLLCLWTVLAGSMLTVLHRIFGTKLSRFSPPFWLLPENGTVLITGASSGLGQAHALHMAKLGYKVLITAPDLKMGQKALEKIKAESGNFNVELFYLDYSKLSTVRDLAKKLKARGIPIHILVNNAGAISSYRITEDGMESLFQINYAGGFLLTHLLMENLKKASPPARIINLASVMHLLGHLDFDNLQAKRKDTQAYADSKLAIVLFTKELQRRLSLEKSEIITVAVHPGVVSTELSKEWPKWIAFIVWLLFKSPAEGAWTQIYLSLLPREQLIPGGYYSDFVPGDVSREGRDPQVAKRLWEETEKLVGIKK